VYFAASSVLQNPCNTAFIRPQGSVHSFHGRKALRSLDSECCKYLEISALITVHGWLGRVDASNQISELLEYSACNGLGGVFTLNRPCSYNLLIKNAVMIRIRKLKCTLYIWSLCGVPSFRDWKQAQNDPSAVPNPSPHYNS